MDKTIRRTPAVITPVYRRHRVTQQTAPATETMLEVNQVSIWTSIARLTSIDTIHPTDVEIQKIRQDKTNPAYSPAQSEPGHSPGKWRKLTFDSRQFTKGGKEQKSFCENFLRKIEFLSHTGV